MSPGPGDSRQWSQWPKLDRAQTMSFLTTQCPPPSSCAMSSLLLLPHRTAEAAEAYGARTRLCSGLWRQKIPSPQCLSIFQASPADAQCPALPPTKAFIYIWFLFCREAQNPQLPLVFFLSSRPQPAPADTLAVWRAQLLSYPH